jgi:hypothetical protein
MWTEEGAMLAKEKVYPYFANNMQINEEYEDMAINLVKE